MRQKVLKQKWKGIKRFPPPTPNHRPRLYLSFNKRGAPSLIALLSLVFICQAGHLEIRTVHGFLDLIGLIEGASLVWSGSAKGFCTGALGRILNQISSRDKN